MSELEEFKDFLERELGTDYYDDFTEGGYHAAIKYAKSCAERKDAIIEQQEKEIEKLKMERNFYGDFVKYMVLNGDRQNFKEDFFNQLKERGFEIKY